MDATLQTLPRFHKNQKDLLKEVIHTLRKGPGACLVEGVLSKEELSQSLERLWKIKEEQENRIGVETLDALGERGVLRLLPAFDPYFLSFLQLPTVTSIVDTLLSPTAILHTQNAILLPPRGKEVSPQAFRYRFHMDFPRVLNGFFCSVNTLFALSDFTEENGGTLIVPYSQQLAEAPQGPEKTAISATCPAGSMLIFDSTLWHASGPNCSSEYRFALNQQFTHSYFKQQVDYVRALKNLQFSTLPERTQQILGYHTRLPCQLEDFYLPKEQRLYRSGQG